MKDEKTTFQKLQHQKAMRITSQLRGLRLLLANPIDNDAFDALERQNASHGISDIVHSLEEQANDLQSSLETDWIDPRTEIDSPIRDVTLVCLWDVLVGIKDRQGAVLDVIP